MMMLANVLHALAILSGMWVIYRNEDLFRRRKLTLKAGDDTRRRKPGPTLVDASYAAIYFSIISAVHYFSIFAPQNNAAIPVGTSTQLCLAGLSLVVLHGIIGRYLHTIKRGRTNENAG